MATSFCVCVCCNKKRKRRNNFIVCFINCNITLRISIKYVYFLITCTTLGIVSGKKGKKYTFFFFARSQFYVV